MPMDVTGPGGVTVTFPDGTDHGTIDSVMRQHFGLPAAGDQSADSSPVTANSVVREAAKGVLLGGGLANKLDAATAATIAPLANQFFKPEDQLNEPDWRGRYEHSLRDQDSGDQKFEEA